MGEIDTEDKATQVYELYRSALLNQKYYGRRLRCYRGWNKGLEIILAIGTSTLIGSLAIWQTLSVDAYWQAFAAAMALLVIVKPILNLAKEVEKYTRLFTVHTELFYELKNLVWNIQIQKGITEEISHQYSRLRARYDALARDDDPVPSERLRKKLFDDVNRELPPDRFWVPNKIETRPA